MKTTLNLKYNNDIVCPYCGCRNDYTSEDILSEDTYEKYECSDCGREFKYCCNHKVTFNSYGICKEGEHKIIQTGSCWGKFNPKTMKPAKWVIHACKYCGECEEYVWIKDIEE